MTFEKDGIVSLWVGAFRSEDDLFGYLEFRYDDDGNASSQFASHSGLGWFDHDFQEASFLGGHPSDKRAALEGHSYIESFIDVASEALEKVPNTDWNSVLVLYNCSYDPASAHPSKACQLIYVGCFGYSSDSGPGDTEI